MTTLEKKTLSNYVQCKICSLTDYNGLAMLCGQWVLIPYFIHKIHKTEFVIIIISSSYNYTNKMTFILILTQ